ncbi:helix-turn-helix domain-containing protein [Pseudonocardia sp. GCM10023141]|uniref:helix-turn-helix domain-containing protein n=1 Tax=Pseudonocardia sp. GCM10023141 TaxID=3252653 RepID=UPI00360A65BD
MLRSVAVLVLDELIVFEFGILCEVFGVDRTADGLPPIDFRVCGVEAGAPVRAGSGVDIVARHGLDGLAGADLVAIPATNLREYPEAALEAVRAAAAAGATVLTICSGVFVAGAAGLLDGRRCTSHWQCTAELQARHPGAVIDPAVLFVDDGSLVSSAGSAAGIDACLHVIRRELGTAAVNTVARLMVVPPQRDGGQRQFLQLPVPQYDGAAIAPTLDWVLENLDVEHSVADIARRSHMSERTFTRRFLAETGTTPHRWLTQQRVLRARQLLEDTTLTIDEVSASCGFSTAAMLRHHFRTAVGVAPGDYRRTFRQPGVDHGTRTYLPTTPRSA